MSKKFILAIQGEGRGHLTQAISMYELLIEKGHTVSAIIIGSSGKRKIPEFLNQKIKSPIIQITSTNIVTEKKNKSINIRKSIIKGIREIKSYKNSLKKIDDILKTHQPDVIINFFDLLIGLYYRFYKPQIKLICVGHQYIYFHQDFEFPIGKMLDKFLIKSFTRLTAYGSSKNLALSFYNIHTNSKDVIVVPPLLRKEIFDNSHDTDVFVCGNASACILPWQVGTIKGSQRLFSNSGSASMGHDLPTAIGLVVLIPLVRNLPLILQSSTVPSSN